MEIITALYAYRYLGLFFGTLFEGPVVMAAAGFGVKLGYLDAVPAYLILMFGDLVADIAWYYVGHFGARKFIEKFGRFFGVTEKIVEKVKGLFHEHHNKILFFSKITMGFGLAVPILVTAGISRVPIKKYIILNFLGGFIWTAALMILGYFFGNLYLLISDSLRLGFIIGAGLLLAALIFGFGKFLRNEVLKNRIL